MTNKKLTTRDILLMIFSSFTLAFDFVFVIAKEYHVLWLLHSSACVSFICFVVTLYLIFGGENEKKDH